VANIAVLGSTGMLGSAMTRVLRENSVNILEFNRRGVSATGGNKSKAFDAIKKNDLIEIFKKPKFDYIINCVGVVNKLINNEDQDSIDYAYKINAEFPAALDECSIKFGIPVITIGTDCVYSGKSGKYSEINAFDPIDHYGISKSIGEKAGTSSMVIRSSIIGREKNTSNSLLEWVLAHPKDAVIYGYVNHIWNGVTVLHFSQVVLGVILNANFRVGIFHLVPNDSVSKYELLHIIAREFGRADLMIEKFEAASSINRSLITTDIERNLQLWQDGGYNQIPTIDEMISTYSTWIQSR
jgi:dTDP-4-dehydrorhamnose reductase